MIQYKAHEKHTDLSLRRNHDNTGDQISGFSEQPVSVLRDQCLSIYRSVANSGFSSNEFISQFMSFPCELVDCYDRIG